ncbi:MAG: chemotaxis protein CheD [Myxococcota bacterium]
MSNGPPRLGVRRDGEFRIAGQGAPTVGQPTSNPPPPTARAPLPPAPRAPSAPAQSAPPARLPTQAPPRAAPSSTPAQLGASRPFPPAPGAGPAQASAAGPVQPVTGPRLVTEPRIVVGINDMKTSRVGTLITIGLGSCIGVCMWDPTTHTGGLCHYMLPESKVDMKRAQGEPLMFGDRAVGELIAAFKKLGGRLESTVVYLAGGASMNPGNDLFDIGARNATVARDMITRAGMKVARGEMGGRISRTLALDVATGLVTVATPGLAIRRLS